MSKEAAQLTTKAPRRLRKLFSGAGYKVELLITRAATSDRDPDAVLPDITEPFDKLARNDVKRMLAAYAVDEGSADDGKRVGDE